MEEKAKVYFSALKKKEVTSLFSSEYCISPATAHAPSNNKT